jgi:hypothetical protein
MRLVKRSIGAILSLLLAACAPDGGPYSRPHGDPAALQGRWGIHLEMGGDSAAVGAVRLLPATPPKWKDGLFLGDDNLAGNFRLDRSGFATTPPRDSTLHGYLADDQTLSLSLPVFGGCGDCGNIYVEGRVRGDSIRGRWMHESLGEE